MTGNFLGGTTASLLAVVIYGHWGWHGITIATLAATLLATTALVLESRHARSRPASPRRDGRCSG